MGEGVAVPGRGARTDRYPRCGEPRCGEPRWQARRHAVRHGVVVHGNVGNLCLVPARLQLRHVLRRVRVQGRVVHRRVTLRSEGARLGRRAAGFSVALRRRTGFTEALRSRAGRDPWRGGGLEESAGEGGVGGWAVPAEGDKGLSGHGPSGVF